MNQSRKYGFSCIQILYIYKSNFAYSRELCIRINFMSMGATCVIGPLAPLPVMLHETNPLRRKTALLLFTSGDMNK